MLEPNVAMARYDCMTELSPEQKRTDLRLGSVVLGVLFLAAVSGSLFWVILPP
jgi:hypothetical protein